MRFSEKLSLFVIFEKTHNVKVSLIALQCIASVAAGQKCISINLLSLEVVKQ